MSACIEVWHRPSRSLAAVAAQRRANTSAVGRPMQHADGLSTGDVQLGSGVLPLVKLLFQPQVRIYLRRE